MPEDQTRADYFLDGEEIELLTQHAMISLPRLLQPIQVCVQVLLLKPGGSVDPLEHLPLLVSSPVRSRCMKQLEVLEAAGARDVWTATEVHERTIGVHGNGLVVPQLGNSFQLQGVIGKTAARLAPVDDFPNEGEITRSHLGHLGFEPLQIFRCKGTIHLEVVVEPVFDGRSEPDARCRKKLAHSRGQDVSRGVAEELERLRVALGQDRHGSIGFDRPI